MRVAAVQFRASKADPQRSLDRLLPLARSAATGADLVVLPEMCTTGYVFANADAIRPCAEPADGRTFQALRPVARESGCWLVAGFPEADGASLYNSALVIDPNGDLAFVYRKTLLFESDESWASPGDSGYRRFETRAGAFTVGICMDLNDDGFIDWCAAADLRAIAFPTNWLEQGIDVWRYWVWRNDTEAALVAANSYGPDGDVELCGQSAILDGNVLLASAPSVGDGVIRAELEHRNGSY